ncbi:MAG: polysaccharide biosynthesis/export family protein [Pirellulaceae bacterium]
MKIRIYVLCVALLSAGLPSASAQQPIYVTFDEGNSSRVIEVAPSAASGTVQPAPAMMPSAPALRGAQTGNFDRCNFSACNPPPQPQVAKGRCQACTVGVDCADNCGHQQTWRDLHPYEFQPLAHGEYLGPVRLPSTMDYRVRVGDRIRFTYLLSRDQPVESNYRLQVGDELQISSVTDDSIRVGDLVQGRGVVILPDGTLTLPMIGQVFAKGMTIPQLRKQLETAYKEQIRNPAIDVLPIKINTRLEDTRAAVDARAGQGGQAFLDSVHPDGTLRLPKVGSICVQGMTLDEIKREVNLRYREVVTGLEIEPQLDTETPHFIYVYGEVNRPDRYELRGPTTVTQALALAQGVRVGGNAREIVIFRRAEDWRLISTRIDLKGVHLGKVAMPTDEIWLRDSDLIIVPPTPIQRFDNFVRQVFTEGLYGVFPLAQIGSGLEARNGIFNQ